MPFSALHVPSRAAVLLRDHTEGLGLLLSELLTPQPVYLINIRWECRKWQAQDIQQLTLVQVRFLSRSLAT